MTEGDQDKRGVAVAVSTLLRLFGQLLDFLRCQVFAGSQIRIGRADRTDRKTLFGSTSRRDAFIGLFLDIEN
jgi:hypothetical protein